ncbi:hypothetical protein LWI28_007679 [Acer negundo]|uniref:PCI domain-containing protein n=1 Tax=Acer negundo TaxID=4023 RepID=A0AAD5NZP3_ACENE|nr:hypothetical protein LWI28_007679 [Acer negundo]
MESKYSGFGKQSGPSGPPKSVVFGQFTPPPSSSLSTSGPEVVERTRSPPLPLGNFSGPAVRPFQPFRVRGPEAPQRAASPPSAFHYRRPATGPSFPSAGDVRPVDTPYGLDNRNIPFVKDYDAETHLRPSSVTSLVASHNSGTSATAKIARFQDLKRTRSPPLLARDEEFPRNSNQTTITRPFSTSPVQDDIVKLRGNHFNSPAHQDQSRVSARLGSYNSESSMGQLGDMQAPKRARSPPVPSANGVPWENPQFTLNDSKRLGARSNALLRAPDSQAPQRSVSSMNNTVTSSSRPTGSPVSKRTRSPTFLSTDEGFLGNSNSTQYDTDREMQAKAKRLARFKVELSENVEKSPDVADRQELSAVEMQKFVGEHSIGSSRDYPNDSTTSDYEGSGTSSVIIGICPDMCPESERGERERKGDLDQFERLDGDRNQSSKYIAVKKYTRTAEREANLIRPMPILQKTLGYLLNLLNQPYDERFLGLYNFLWDRMRAIRMDLRMQHIFNQGAITMLEQMIRLHIIAMHELCEYTKGEGFSEGFDAHLNIEQMNKTSVELFQMYDDHRKKGISVPTEKEFRGYYALLKLDKHPGYKVEPAELSLDLAKMTPEIRQMPEVLFARAVARACRTGNFIAFFRLARKASYLQACLMHAHFAKLRTQALASLHAGLLNNQGLPVSHVGRWLGMEEEDIESLLEYHGFSIKEFEEPYMVKDGLFLNNDKDYPTKCSKLVNMKRSERIVEDMLASNQVISSPTGATKAIQLGKIPKQNAKTTPVKRKIAILPVDEAMHDSITISLQNNCTPVQPVSEISMVDQQRDGGHKVTVPCISPLGFSVAHSSPKSQPAKVVMEEKQNNDALFRMTPAKKIVPGVEGLPMQIVSKTPHQDRSPSFKRYDYTVENAQAQSVAIDNIEDEEPSVTFEENENDGVMENEIDEEKENDKVVASYLEEEVALAKLRLKEVALAKLKLIIRLWRRRSLKQKELREQRQLAANAALNSLSAGPPIRQNKDQLSTAGEFDIDYVMRERSEKHEQSWSRLNVSDVIASILGSRNPDAKCLCWKIILCSQDSQAGDKQMQRSHISHIAAEPWLFSKIMPPAKDDDDNLLVSSSGLSIWKKWVPSKSGTDVTCCISIVKETKFDYLGDTMSGASAILFLVSDSIPWKLQKVKLHNLLMSIPSGSRLPLLILSGSYCEEILDPYSVIVNELGLHDIDKSRVNSFSVKFLVGNHQMGHSDGFFSDEQLREGLQWLASESPLQPVVYSVKTRELILTHLNYALGILDKLSDYEVGPNHYISAFNEALDQSLGEIVAAAKANPTIWPCPEIASVEDSSDEHFVANWSLPRLGWSSAARIEPLVSALRDLKLTTFPDISWLSRGANMGKEIENQRFQLENCLVSYLTLSSQMMGVPLATKEASIMLQRSTRLELHNSSYYIIPKWVMIFRRIFNWRLMSLNDKQLSTAYVLEQQLVSPSTGDLDNLGPESSLYPPYSLSNPSLDEIMEVGHSPFSTQTAQLQPQVLQYMPEMESNGEVQETADTNNLVEDERNSSQNGKLSISGDFSYITNKLNSRDGEIMVSKHVTKETDNLSNLLEQCILVQNTNGKKLSVYF